METLWKVINQSLSVTGQNCRLYLSMADAMNDGSHWITFSIILGPFMNQDIPTHSSGVVLIVEVK